MTSSPETRRVLQLEVASVGVGGNAGDGRYFYAFDRNDLLFEDPMDLEILLTDDAASRFDIVDLVSTAPDEIKVQDSTAGRSILAQNRCRQPQMIFLNVLVSDRQIKSAPLIVCDPQVINRPKRTMPLPATLQWATPVSRA